MAAYSSSFPRQVMRGGKRRAWLLGGSSPPPHTDKTQKRSCSFGVDHEVLFLFFSWVGEGAPPNFPYFFPAQKKNLLSSSVSLFFSWRWPLSPDSISGLAPYPLPFIRRSSFDGLFVFSSFLTLPPASLMASNLFPDGEKRLKNSEGWIEKDVWHLLQLKKVMLWNQLAAASLSFPPGNV